ncbi:hypothetical protein JDS90_33180, partial [Bacillus cereus]|nr:hypothetical protein [Bacillus cereus]MBJ8038516.1 hypothetical protein [Bacillus cereus]
ADFTEVCEEVRRIYHIGRIQQVATSGEESEKTKPSKIKGADENGVYRM